MNPEEQSLLEKIYKLTEENNNLLKSIQRTNRFSLVVKVLYWVIIIGLSFGALFFIQPYINSINGVLESGDKSGINGVSPYKSYTDNVMELLK